MTNQGFGFDLHIPFLEELMFDEEQKKLWDEDEEIFFGKKHAIQVLPTFESGEKCKAYYFYRPMLPDGSYKPKNEKFEVECGKYFFFVYSSLYSL